MTHWTARYVGRPFSEDGLGPRAYHCWGLVRAVYRDCLGIDLPTYGEISARDLSRAARAIGAGQDVEPWHDVDTPQAYDVCVMALPRRRWPGHVGVMVDSRTVMHVEAATHVCVVPVDHFSIRHRVMGYRRHRSA